MKIALITNDGFPSGLATTNRIISLLKGLEIHGVSPIKVYCVRPTELSNNIINKNWNGWYTENISFLYTSKSIIWPKNRISKAYVKVKGHLLFFCFIIKENQNGKIDFLIDTTSDFIPGIFYKILASLLNFKLLLTVDEYPRVVRDPTKRSKLFKWVYLRFFYKRIDGIIVMTKVLHEYYKKLTSKKCRFVHIPMTVELERFDNAKSKVSEKAYIAYCGNLGHNQKDGVPILIKSFKCISDNFPNINLYIIGSTKSSEIKQFEELKKLTVNLGLENRVIFTGKIHRDELPQLLCNAKILALARPDSIQAQGGFPTKLGEYLATGNPVVVTNVGEIPDYLENGISCFMAKSDDVESFAQKLSEAIKSKDAEMIGKAGKKVAQDIFNYKIQGARLKEFLVNFK